MKTLEEFYKTAQFFREATGSAPIGRTLKKTVEILTRFEIPHLVCGGYAVQEHGYRRFTDDVDVIVPDVELAREKLSLNGFRENPGSKMTVTDRETAIGVDLLPGGGRVSPGPVEFPVPRRVSAEPIVVSLKDLISIKLSSWVGAGSGERRLKDRSDVGELVLANGLSRDFDVDERVKKIYQAVWDGLRVGED